MELSPISVLLCLLSASGCWGAWNRTEAELEAFLRGVYEPQSSKTCTAETVANWNYETNMSDETSDKIVKVTLQSSKEQKAFYDEWFKEVDLKNITDLSIRRQVMFEKRIGASILDEHDVELLTKTQTKMTDIYSTAKICPFAKQNCDLKKEGLNLEPEINDILTKSTNYDELSYVWTAWRNASGKKIRPLFQTYVDAENKAAKLNGFQNNAAMWMADYEMPNLEADVDRIWLKLKPLYEKLHSYVRTKLIGVYGKEKIGTDGLIPAHLFGNMWAQSWSGLSKLVRPYPKEPEINVTAALLKHGYTPLKMFQIADEFYKSLGLPSNNVSFGNDSMITRPKNVDVTCHASAWDFCDKKTYRIKMCTEVNAEYFVTIHHEMGHIQYFLQYKDQPKTFRDGANPGFHEAIGDTVALSVGAPSHLVKIGLLDKYAPTKEASVNALMDMALEKIAFIPFGLLVDKWRWEVFAGNVSSDKWNDVWWRYRQEYQKVKAPVNRSETDFDPGAKYHVDADSQYINYFIATVLQFQFYRSFCIASGQYNKVTRDPPLHNCDFYNSTIVGNKFKAGLSLGKSKHWKEVLKAMTGEDDLDPSALLEYFEPLEVFLNHQNSSKSSGAGTSFSNLFLISAAAVVAIYKRILLV